MYNRIKFIFSIWHFLSIIVFPVHLFAQLDKPITLFSHGIADVHQVFRYYNLGLIKKPFYSFSFPDATPVLGRINRHFSVFGQDDDIACLSSAYDRVCALQPDKPLVLYGVSRGASTIVNFLAQKQQGTIRGIVLESPFAAIDDIVAYLSHKKWIPECLVRKIFSFIFPRYQWTGKRPIDLVLLVPKNIPILIIGVSSDERVPCASTIVLYNALLKAGCDVYLTLVNVGSHARLFLAQDWPLYKSAVHAFYKKCGLEHDADLAQAGEHLLISEPYVV